MPSFEPFRGVRYDAAQVDLADVTAPPYDVINPAQRAQLVDRHRDNVVLIDLPDEAEGPGRYDEANRRFRRWLDDGLLLRDEQPSFYGYRMDYVDDLGNPAHTVGVMGALALSRPDEGELLPHEHTTPKAKSDRLDLMRATAANLSPVWVLSLSEGLSDLLDGSAASPLGRFTDDDGVTHRFSRIADEELLAAIAEAVARTPAVIADGHHRYETALAYRGEHPDAPGVDRFLALVVELVDDQLTVRPIHRLVDVPAGTDLEAALAAWFEPGDDVPVDDKVLARMGEAGALALVKADGSARLLRPRAEAFAGVADLDSARVARALEAVAGADVRYQHGVDQIVDAVTAGEAGYGILLRPATVDQIKANAHTSERMPPKTTFFHPKPRTGLVFRLLD